jgi:hypothetical protein
MNTTGDNNVALGQGALQISPGESGNTPIGTAALAANASDGYNTAIGAAAPSRNSGGTTVAADRTKCPRIPRRLTAAGRG